MIFRVSCDSYFLLIPILNGEFHLAIPFFRKQTFSVEYLKSIHYKILSNNKYLTFQLINIPSEPLPAVSNNSAASVLTSTLFL